MSLNYEILNWDSQFFGLKIAKINNQNIESNSEMDEILTELSNENVKLVYLVVNEQNSNSVSILNDIDKPITTNVTFALQVKDNKIETWEGVEIYNQTEVESELYDLAIQAGHDSRYKLDNRFKHGEFERLYRLWIENSVNKSFADYVFIYRNNDVITGFITLKINNDSGTIGLIAVDETKRGLGIGKKLINQVLQTLVDLNISTCLVATQKENIGAVKFYESVGFSALKSEVYYHIWL
jgi:dTDP-4-amino-4,6-dideoxy-D-galactose acyltransferase